MFLETASVQVRRKNQDSLADFLNRLRNLVECRGERLDVFALQRSDESFAELFGQLLGDPFVFPPAGDEFLEALRPLVMLQFAEECDEMVDAAVGLLSAGFEQIKKFFVVTKELADREHKIIVGRFCETPSAEKMASDTDALQSLSKLSSFYSIAPRIISKAMLKSS